MRIGNQQTAFVYLSSVSAIDEQEVQGQLKISKILLMPKMEMTHNEVEELFPNGDGWYPLRISLN
jgi:hypothetical protein